MLKKSRSVSIELETINQYFVGPVNVRIVRGDSKIKYVVSEPRLEDNAYKAYQAIRDYLSRKEEISIDDIWEAGELLGLTDIVDKYFPVIDYYLRRDRGYGKLDVLFKDNLIEEIKIRPGPIYVIHRSIYDIDWIETNIVMESIEETRKYLFLLARKAGKFLSPAFPILEFRLPEGHRVLAIYGDVSDEPEATIRKFPKEPLNILHIVGHGTLSPLLAAFLWLVVEAQGFLLIVGPQGSGKTTLMACLLDLAPPDKYVVTVEETPEIRLTRKLWTPLWIREPLTLSLEAAKTRIGFRKLLKTSLRTRAQYIAVSEARGKEIRYLFEASALGSGSLATFHAGSINDFEKRIKLLRIPPEIFNLLWGVAIMRKIKGVGYRLVELYEYNGIEFELLVKWDHVLDRHVFVKDPVKSIMLRKACDMLNYDVEKELVKRTEIITHLVSKGNFSLDNLFREIGWL